MSDSLASLGIDADSILRYNLRIPRYTSYPTAPCWTEEFGPEAWAQHLAAHADSRKPLSLYVHIPFCGRRCLFCGCNVIITRKGGVAADYVKDLGREAALLRRRYPAPAPVIQLHLGGGTPNFLKPDEMSALLDMLGGHFDFSPQAERSIEVDPRTADRAYIRFLHERHGFNRISFGVQDFHPATQQAIGRGQTREASFRNVAEARRVGFESVNIDLIYGLPGQTEASWRRTLDEIVALRPDRIALYNFAYLPARMAHQQRLDPEAMPPADTKLRMFIETHDRLCAEGWVFIGMDHYALESDGLEQARRRGALRRNFMGYTTLRGTDLLGLGVSSISDFQGAFAQNVKKLSQYRRLLDEGRLPVERGLMLDDADRLRQAAIEELMCNGRLRFEPMAGFDGERYRELADRRRPALEALAEDGLLEIESDGLRVTGKGRLFLRNIACVFDAYLEAGGQTPIFSKAV